MSTNDSDKKLTFTFSLTKVGKVHKWIERVRVSSIGTVLAFTYYALLIGMAILWLVIGDIHDVAVSLQVFLVASAWAIYPAIMKLRAMMAATPQRKHAIERTAATWMTPMNCVLFVLVGLGYLLGPSSTRMTSRLMGGTAILFGAVAALLIFRQWNAARVNKRTAKEIDALLADRAALLGVTREECEGDIAYWRRILVAWSAKFPMDDSLVVNDLDAAFASDSKAEYPVETVT